MLLAASPTIPCTTTKPSEILTIRASRPSSALVDVDQDRGECRGDDPGHEAVELEPRVERAERQEPFPQEPGEPRHQDAPEGRLAQAVVFSLCNRSSCSWHHCRPPFVEGDSPAQDEVDELRVVAGPRVDRAQDRQILLVAARRASSRPSACSRGRLSAKKSRSSDSSRSSIVSGAAEQPLARAPCGRRRSARRRAAHARRSRRPRPRSGLRPRGAAAPGRSGRSSQPRRSASSGRRRS